MEENGFFYASSAQSSLAPEKESWLFPELSDIWKKKVKVKNLEGHSPFQEIPLSLFSCVPILPPLPWVWLPLKSMMKKLSATKMLWMPLHVIFHAKSVNISHCAGIFAPMIYLLQILCPSSFRFIFAYAYTMTQFSTTLLSRASFRQLVHKNDTIKLPTKVETHVEAFRSGRWLPTQWEFLSRGSARHFCWCTSITIAIAVRT